MIARKCLLLVLVLIASTTAASAQGSGSMRRYVGSSSFSIDIPTGWTADEEAAKRSDAVFVLVPKGVSGGNKAPMSITCVFSENMVMTVAMHRYKRGVFHLDPAAQFVELSLIDAGDPRIIVEELHRKAFPFPPTAVAFIPLGSGVFSITFSARAEEAYKQGMGKFLKLLESYKDGDR